MHRLLARTTMAAVAGFACALVPSAATAGEAAVAEFQRAAYAGDFKGGIARLKAMAAADPNDVEAVIASGTLQFFGAFATMQEGFYRHSTPGLPANGSMGTGQMLGMMGMGAPMAWTMGGPTLVPPNPRATPMTYRALRGIFERFVSDMAAAEAALALVKDRPVKLPVQPSRIAMDLDHDGAIQPGERLFAPLFGLGRMPADTTFAFDTADASWLRGYSHVMLAAANLSLAFNFERSFEATGHTSYGLAATAFGRELQRQMARKPDAQNLKAKIAAIDAKVAALRNEQSAHNAAQSALRARLSALPRTPDAMEERRIVEAELRSANVDWQRFSREQSRLHTERMQLHEEMTGQPPGGSTAWMMDVVAMIHTLSWDVVEPARLRAVRTHLLQVMALNRNTWRLVRAETDDDREWLPSPRQSTPFGVKLTDEIIDSWIATTTLAEQVLNGEKLLPHPRFRDKGINLRKLLETAKRVDLVMLVTGHDLLPYLETGEIVDGDTWRRITNPMQDNLALYAVWFN